MQMKKIPKEKNEKIEIKAQTITKMKKIYIDKVHKQR